MASREYGVTTDYDYSAEHKRQRIEVWTGPWFHSFEAEGYSLPSGGFMLITYNGDKVRVPCDSPRTESNYEDVDKAIDYALKGYHILRGDIVVGA